MKLGDMLEACSDGTAFGDGNPEIRHSIKGNTCVVFLGETRWHRFRTWECKVLTAWGPVWMWASDLFFGGIKLSHQENVVQSFRRPDDRP